MELLKTQLEPDTWGEKLTKMRRDRDQHAVAQIINRTHLFDYRVGNSDISRIESLEELPTSSKSARRRQIAYVACIAYGYDPRVVGLSLEVLPLRLREMGYETICDQVRAACECIREFAGQLVPAA